MDSRFLRKNETEEFASVINAGAAPSDELMAWGANATASWHHGT